MPFTLHPEVAAAMHAMFGDNPPPPVPAGDIKTRREMLDGFFAMLTEQIPKIADVATKDFVTKAADGADIRLRWYTKKDAPLPGSAVVYAHGGGMIALNMDQYDDPVMRYVTRTGVPFLSVDHRRSPEVRAPTQVTDTYAGLVYLHQHAAELGVDPSRIGIMGDSGGGGIAAGLAHYIKLKGGPAAKKQILVYPMLDDRNVTPDPNLAPFATWTYDDNSTAWNAILGEKRGADDVDPIEAPARMTVQDARGLPPAYIDVGEIDIFRNEDIQYAATLTNAGVECEFHLYPGVPHAWENMAPEMHSSRQAVDNRCRAILSL